MSEPTTSTALAIWLSVLATTLFKDVNSDALIGALCGGLVFMIYSKQYGLLARFCLMLVSVLIGYHAAHDVAIILRVDSFTVSAFIAACVIVTVVLMSLDKFRDLNLQPIIHEAVLKIVDAFAKLFRRK